MLKLSNVAQIQIGLENADFYLTRRGSIESVGAPSLSFNKESIGIKITSEGFDPKFMFYWFEMVHRSGAFKQIATGSLSLVNIRIEDIKNIPLAQK